MSYDEVMLRYGSDRPDRRLGGEIHDLGEVFARTEFNAFRGVLEAGGVVRGLKARGEFPRRRLDELTERAKQLGAKGLVWAVDRVRGLALADRQVPLRRRDDAAGPRRSARARATCC